MEVPLVIQGDSAVSVLKRLKDSQISRKRSKTAEELGNIKARIKQMLDDYDDSIKCPAEPAHGSVEIFKDMDQFEALLKDEVLKNKYQQNLTIFIVGYKNLCSQRLDILGQLSEFFTDYTSVIEDEFQLSSSDNDIESLNFGIQDTLTTMDVALQNLDNISHDVMKYMNHLHNISSGKNAKTKKKLEKSLQNAKGELLKMTEKISHFQQDVSMKTERLQQLSMHLDAKKVEMAHLKTQAEVEKKTNQTKQESLKQERNALQLNVEALQKTIADFENRLAEISTSTPEMTVSQSNRRVEEKLQEIRDAAVAELRSIKLRMNAQALTYPDITRELAEHFHVQMEQISQVHKEELESWKEECRAHIHNILITAIKSSFSSTMTSVSTVSSVDLRQMKAEVELSEEDAHRWMEQDNNDLTEKVASPYHTSSVYSDKKLAEGAGQVTALPDEDLENNMDEDSTEALSADQLRLRLQEYQDKSEKQISVLNERVHSMEVMQQNMTKEAMKWQEERSQLLSNIEQLQLLQEATEADAEEVMRNLEEFATEQEQKEIKDADVVENVSAEDSLASLTESNVQKVSGQSCAASPSTFSKPTSPTTTCRFLASAYRQKISEKRNAINRRKKESALSRTDPETPQMKGMFDTGLLEEFLRAYRAVVEFKDTIAQEMSRYSAHQARAHAINAIHTANFDTTNDQVQLYVSNMSTSVEHSLLAISESVTSALNAGRTTQGLEIDDLLQRNVMLQVNASFDYSGDSSVDTVELSNSCFPQYIQTYNEELRNLRDEHEKRTQHDAAVIMHMQNTISETQRGNTTAAGTSGSGFPSSPAGPMMGKTPSSSQRPATNDSDLTMVFTRRDAEENTIALKKSAAIGKVTQGTLNSVVVAMETYNSIPTRRIQHLANKLMHHTKMKTIETNVRNSNLVTSEVFSILEKMENLQQRRAQHWSRQMDEMTLERRRLGALLSSAFQRLESITGVFLIKPIISYKGKGFPKKYSGKISTRFNKYQMEAMLQKMQQKSTSVFAGSAPYNVMQVNVMKLSPSLDRSETTKQMYGAARAGTTTQSQSSSLNVLGLKREESPDMWNVGAASSHSLPTSRIRREDRSPISNQLQHPFTVPKLLELDVSRFQLDSTSVHSYIPPEIMGELGHDRLHSVEALNRQSHASFSRNASNVESRKGSQIEGTLERASDVKSSAPPTTPASAFQMLRNQSRSSGVRSSDEVFVSDDNASLLPKPLPPIRRSSTHTTLSSATSNKTFSPALHLSPSRSMPDMNAREPDSKASTPTTSARKDMATSPVYV